MSAEKRSATPPSRPTTTDRAKTPSNNVSGVVASKDKLPDTSVFGLPAVLSAAGLEHVATHKYVPGKYTPLDNLMNDWWLFLANLLPMWLAPNLVTLLGFIPMMCSFALAWHFSPHFSEPPPRWLALLTSCTTYLYQTLDALDGKQARRTGSSSPLGQLFDHGCDCLAVMPVHSAAALLLLPGTSVWTLAGLAGLQTGFFFAQWQEYHTGVLRTSFGPLGVTETQFGLMGAAFIGFLLGPDAVRGWSTSSMSVPWSNQPQPKGEVFICLWSVFILVLIAISCAKTTKTVLKDKGKAGLVVAAKHLLPIITINIALFLVWDRSVAVVMPRKLCFLTGILFFYFTAQMILCSMAKMEYPILQLETLPAYLALAVSSRFLPSGQLSLVLSAASLCLVAWVGLWLHRVMRELKSKLGIRAFHLKAKADDKKN